MTLTTVDNRLTHFKTRAAKGLARVTRLLHFEKLVSLSQTADLSNLLPLVGCVSCTSSSLWNNSKESNFFS